MYKFDIVAQELDEHSQFLVITRDDGEETYAMTYRDGFFDVTTRFPSNLSDKLKLVSILRQMSEDIEGIQD